jgi:hypothetical protein
LRTIHHVFSVSARPDRVFGALTSGEGGLDVGSSFDGVIAGRPLRLHVVGEITATDFGGALDWSTLTAADSVPSPTATSSSSDRAPTPRPMPPSGPGTGLPPGLPASCFSYLWPPSIGLNPLITGVHQMG